MKKVVFCLLVLSSLSLAILALQRIGLLNLTGFFLGFGEPATEFEWWNVSWHYRFRIEVNSTSYSRTDWPIEYQVNFTDLLPSGSFDENSVRVFEYSPSGSILYEVPSQFDKEEGYDSSSNAIGTIVFLMNGTTQANSKRIYFVYYDTEENGPKSPPSYPTSLSYSWDNQIVNVNNTLLKFYIDTNRGENTSGIYHVEDIGGTVVITAGSSSRTAEYLEYSNGTNNLSFDLRNNASFVQGPVRLTIKQIGDEIVFGNPSQTTGEARVIKKYHIYNKAGPQTYGTFIRIVQEIENTANYDIERKSTPAGALAFDLDRTLSSGSIDTLDFNSSDPYSWVWGSGYGGEMVGIINLLEEGTSNYFSTNSTSYGRIGIQLDTEIIPPGSSIKQDSLVYFAAWGGSDAVSEFLAIKDRFVNPVKIVGYLPEVWYVEIFPYTNATVYNRNETVLILANVSVGDPYNLTKYMNATLDMGTSSPDDDQTIILYDDGTHGDAIGNDKVFTNTFDIADDAAIGTWTINFTSFTENFEFLNSTSFTFNITNVLNVAVNITNKKPMVGSIVIANIYVKNYRQDSWIGGAMINCSYDSVEVINKTDYNNGTYSVNFTAPVEEGEYILSCNATKNGNFGNNTDTFSAEPGNTTISIVVQPQNPIVSGVTLYENDSFVIEANASNFGNATAYSTNITLELLSGWSANITLEQCGDLEKNGYCVRSFKITVPNNTSPGNYYINVTATWVNPDQTISWNKTEVNVSVESNPKIDVEQEKISGEAGDGIWSIVGNFTVFSIGNDVLQNITFSCVSDEVCNNFLVIFIPENISSLEEGSKENVSINVTIPLGFTPGTYTGTINVSAQNDGFDTFTLEVYVPSKTNVSITTNISSYTASNITQQKNETFYFRANAKNIGNGSARFVNISISVPPDWFVMPSIEECGNLVKEETCQKEFNVTIPKATPPGNYLVNISTNWTQPDNSMGTNKTFITVTVASNPLINVSEDKVSGTVHDGAEETVGNFTVLSIGNDVLQNINFNCISGEVCQDFVVEFIPTSLSSIPPNSNQSVMVNVSVPLSYPTGTYTGTVNVTANNDGFDTFTLEVYVPENRTWSLQPEYCERSTQQPEGTVCEINVTNKGNVKIDFTVQPEEGNYTKVNETSFEVNRLSWHVFKITYNVSGAEPGIYNSTFLVDAIQSNANPDKKTVIVSLVPYIPPIINVSIIPNETEQNTSVLISVNVTDRSGSGIAWTKVNVTRPNGIVDNLNLMLLETNGNLTRWEITYPNGTDGSTSERGIYNITVYARDNIGNEENVNSSFLVYIKFNIFLSTLSDKYYQGDTGSIYYSVRDFANNPVENFTTNFTIFDSQGNITYLSSNFQTNSDGTIIPMPSFSLPSDAPLGNYTLVSNSRFKDEIVNRTLEKQVNYTFQVLSRTVTVTGLFADIETAVVWYPENIMKFGILVYNGEGKPVDPTSMDLTVYDPANNLYFVANLSQMTKKATGYYTYQYAMPINTPSGMFLAVLNVTQNEFQTMKLKAFRVAHGGPYDVRIQLLENEVPQGDYLDFILIIENKGEVTQDVFVEYWVSSQNTTYFTTSEAVLTPALSNQSFTRTAYIYSNQPLGNYLLNVKVSYDTVQPPILANASFIVIARALNITPPPPVYVTYPYLPTGAAPAPTPTEKIFANIFISKYNSNVSLARGFTRIETVIVNNTGQTNLENVSLFLLGIPTSWFNITPETYKILEKDKSVPFLITFTIPKNVVPGEYTATLIATSGVVSDQKKIVITVFESMKELLEEEIKKLEEEFQELQVDVKVAEREGKDVSAVLLYMEEIKSQIKKAKENLESEKLEEALKNVDNARNLISKARDVLNKLEVVKVKAIIPWWVLLIILIPIVVFGIYLASRKKVPTLRPWIISLERLMSSAKGGKKENKEMLVVEKEKILRMLEVLEKEKEEGLISSAAYREMKKSLEEKLAKLEKKLY
ncbi:MAG: NEW3 domain-containing protein [Candidatus Aenigmatarchaeota archaeon]